MIDMDELLEDYADFLLAANSTPGTIEQYLNYPRRIITHTEPDDLNEITMRAIGKWFRKHEHWKPNTRRHANKTLKLFFDWALAEDHVDVHPMLHMKSVRSPQGIPHPVPEDVLMRQMLRADPWQRWLLTLMAETGLRREEAARVHSDDAELHSAGWWLRITGKGRKTRMIPISPELAWWIRSHRGYLFASPRRPGNPVIPSVIGKKIIRALGGRWTPHSLRHRFATIAYARTGDILAVQQLLGHASVATTQIYVKIADEKLRTAANATHIDLPPDVTLEELAKLRRQLDPAAADRLTEAPSIGKRDTNNHHVEIDGQLSLEDAA